MSILTLGKNSCAIIFFSSGNRKSPANVTAASLLYAIYPSQEIIFAAMAREQGLEPRLLGPEPSVLPLDDSRINAAR